MFIVKKLKIRAPKSRLIYNLIENDSLLSKNFAHFGAL